MKDIETLGGCSARGSWTNSLPIFLPHRHRYVAGRDSGRDGGDVGDCGDGGDGGGENPNAVRVQVSMWRMVRDGDWWWWWGKQMYSLTYRPPDPAALRFMPLPPSHPPSPFQLQEYQMVRVGGQIWY